MSAPFDRPKKIGPSREAGTDFKNQQQACKYAETSLQDERLPEFRRLSLEFAKLGYSLFWLDDGTFMCLRDGRSRVLPDLDAVAGVISTGGGV